MGEGGGGGRGGEGGGRGGEGQASVTSECNTVAQSNQEHK